MAAQDDQAGVNGFVSVGDFKFIIHASRATVRGILVPGSVVTVSLSAMYGIYKYVTSKEQEFNAAVQNSMGGDRDDQRIGGIEPGSLRVFLHCCTDERFLEVSDEYGSGKMKERLEKEFLDIGIETERLVIEVENIEEVKKKAEALRMRPCCPQIIVMGGAYCRAIWSIPNEEYMNFVKESAREGYNLLINGGRAVDAVEAAVRFLEDNEHFNAGYGSVLNDDGEVECDAMIMDGNTLNCGSLTSGRNFQNPVSFAKLIMNDPYNCGLSGKGALRFAQEKGFPVFDDNEQLISDRSRRERISYDELVAYINYRMRGQLVREANRDDNAEPVVLGEGGDTVSAVARDAYGHFACAASTGGLSGRKKSRVSDASMVGCGGYANKHGAATTCGIGESIIKMTLARDVVYGMEQGGRNAQDSARQSLDKMKSEINDVGGVIAIDEKGNFGRTCSTTIIGWASIKDNILEFGLDQDEVKRE